MKKISDDDRFNLDRILTPADKKELDAVDQKVCDEMVPCDGDRDDDDDVLSLDREDQEILADHLRLSIDLIELLRGYGYEQSRDNLDD